MKNLTTPQAILFGFGLVAVAVASIPHSSQVITPAFANNSVHRLQYAMKLVEMFKCFESF